MKVLLIDDDDAFTTMLSEYLASEGFACERTADALDGLGRSLTGQFSAVILDVMMPMMDGKELLRRLRQESAVPVLMLTAKGDSVDRVVGLELGADDYVSKPVYPRELVARLRAVLRRARPDASPSDDRKEVQSGPLRIAPHRRECSLNGDPLPLTVTEFDLLLPLAQRPGDVLSKDELSEMALRRTREPYDRSVDVHVSNLRHKIAAFGGGLEIETVRGVGYRLKLST